MSNRLEGQPMTPKFPEFVMVTGAGRDGHKYLEPKFMPLDQKAQERAWRESLITKLYK